jgi:hypothetical protein
MSATGIDQKGNSRGTWRGGLLAGVAVLSLAIGLVAPAGAQAGSYHVNECSPSSAHYGYPDASFSTNSNGYYGPVDCTSLIGLSIQNPVPISIPSYTSWSLTAPPGTVWTNVQFNYSLYYAQGHSASVWMGLNGAQVGLWNFPNNGTHTAGSNGGWRANQLVAAMQCGGSCPQNSGVHVYLYNLQFDLLDEANPQITALGGELLGGGARRGTESLSIAATDVGGGVGGATIKVNGATVSSLSNGCSVGPGGAATSFNPCPPGRWSVPVNTELAPWRTGGNTLEVCVHDYAQWGQANAACQTRVVEVDNVCEGSGGSVPGASLEAGLDRGTGQLEPSVIVRSTRGATVRGTLRSAAGDAIPGANVCLFETADAPGQPQELTQMVKTRGDGGFAVQLPAGPSRKVDLVYRYNNRLVEKANLRLGAVVVPTLKLRPKRVRNGRSVFFSGDVPGPGEAGRVVSMQARTGRKWRTFKQLRTDEKGRFRGRYRFTQTRGRTSYVFRALVKKQGGYPYEPGASPRRTVLVTG